MDKEELKNKKEKQEPTDELLAKLQKERYDEMTKNGGAFVTSMAKKLRQEKEAKTKTKEEAK